MDVKEIILNDGLHYAQCVVPIDLNGNVITVESDASASNQTLQLAQETAINTVLGLKNDPYATDASGVWTLNSIVKGIFSKMLSEGSISNTFDASSTRIRTNTLTTLFDGKILNADNNNLWHNVGTGTAAFDSTGVDANGFDLSVTSGQWLVRQSNRFIPYFSGKPQTVEFTFENMHSEANVIKRIGLFSSSAISPYDTVLDGVWLENTGTEVALVISNSGTETFRVNQSNFNKNILAGHDWSKFNVCVIEFLWLGGLVVKLSIGNTLGGLTLAHVYSHIGQTGVMFRSPNQPVRYEIRSSTGSGILSAICSQVNTDGGTNEAGESSAMFNYNAGSPTNSNVTCHNVGTIYALLGLKKQTSFRNIAIKIVTFGVVNSATSDSGILMLIKDPTLSTPLSYSNVGKVQQGQPANFASTATITAGTGTVIASIPVSSSGEHQEMNEDYLLWLQNKIDDTMSEYVIAYMPTTATQSVCATFTYKTYN